MNRNEQYERLAVILKEKNDVLNDSEAVTWVEVLWEDFETSLAKAGEPYPGEAKAFQYVIQQIDAYGSQLHLFQTKNEKFKHLMSERNLH
ncbi:YfhJ family protein [Exiguobacterium sp. TRN 1102]|uniref:YfhJ family protein n=1 Tax=Exiguobacterium sp. TRN 1102 TaxID=3420732 RepID=UPI003D781020